MRDSREVLGFVVVLILFFGFACGVELNLTDQQKAANCLNVSNNYIAELSLNNFSTTRVSDTLKEAQSIYDAQVVMMIRKSQVDFAVVFPYCEDIANLKKSAFDSRDAFNQLIKFYEGSVDKGVNASSIDFLIAQIKSEIKSERYEKVLPLVEQTYNDILNLKAENTAANLFYKTTSRSLKTFFVDNGIIIIISLGILLVFYLIYRISRIQWIIRKKIEKLELRKQTLKGLVMQTQRDYFNSGKMPESSYRIRTKNFAEMIRDLDRQIPLLKEELAKYSRNKK